MDFFFHSVNRNKLGITLDLTQPEATDIAKRLVKVSDVVIENFSPGVMKRLGIDYVSLKKINPGIIMISLPAVGGNGPLSNIVTYGPSLSALAGLESTIGYPGERVLGQQIGVADANSAIHGALAVLMALYYRKKTGKGQNIELSQLEALISVMGEAFLDYFMNERSVELVGNRDSRMAPHNNYRCKGEDEWISLAIFTDEEWRRFSEAIGAPIWTKQKKFTDTYGRWKNREELDDLISAWTSERTKEECVSLLQKAGVAATPCLDIEGRFLLPHFQEREVYVTVEHPKAGAEWVVGIPWKLSDTPGKVRRAAPLLGQHNDYVFGEILSLSKLEIERLKQKKVIY